jgi:tRNA(Arg) A34 adenosine deaminase TadA
MENVSSRRGRSGANPPDFMGMALAEAERAGARGEIPVGAVIALAGEAVICTGNRTRELNDPTAHAEMLAIRGASQAIGSGRLAGADLYVTLEPCTMCAAAISFARVRRLYFGATDEKGGAVSSGVRFFSSPTCHHVPDVYPGIAELESAALLRAFFRARRTI